MLIAKATLVPANFFSVKHAESYQYAPSYLLPPPSTLLGAFARGLFLLKGMTSPSNEDEARNMIITATVRALLSLARTGVLIKRMRTLESREEEESNRSKPRTDAMVRELVSLPKMEVYYLLDKEKVIKTLGQDYNTEIKRMLYSIDRIGDSESIISTVSVEIIELEATEPPSEVFVNTVVVGDAVEKTVSGNFIYMIMPDLKDRRKPKAYYVPLSPHQKRTDVYKPSTFNVVPKRNVSFVRVGDASILFMGGNP